MPKTCVNILVVIRWPPDGQAARGVRQAQGRGRHHPGGQEEASRGEGQGEGEAADSGVADPGVPVFNPWICYPVLFFTPGSGCGIRCFFDPWIRDKFFTDPGSPIPDPRSPTHISESLMKSFCVNNTFYSLSIGSNFFQYLFKNEITVL